MLLGVHPVAVVMGVGLVLVQRRGGKIFRAIALRIAGTARGGAAEQLDRLQAALDQIQIMRKKTVSGDFSHAYQSPEELLTDLKLIQRSLAEGKADLYPRFGRTMEWDTAAPQAVLEAAGGTVSTLDGTPLRYGKTGWENPHFICTGVPS